MGQVTVRVNGRDYRILCEDGEESRVGALAGDVDRRVSELAAKVGQIGDAHLMVMASLIVADELAEARDRLEAARPAATAAAEAALAEALAALAERVERIAVRLESA